MRITRKHRIAVSGICAVVAISALFLSFADSNNTSSQTVTVTVAGGAPATSGSCSTGLTLSAYSPAAPAGSLSGLTDINLVVSPSVNQQISKVIIMARGTGGAARQIGHALSNATSSYVWSFKWATALWPNGPVNLSAGVYFNGSSSICAVGATTTYIISNTQPTEFSVEAVLPEWIGPINTTQAFTAKVHLTSSPFDPTLYSIYDWSTSTSIGNISSDGDRVYFSSGPVAGKNTITAKVSYGGAEKTVTIPVSVEPNSALTTQTTTSATTSATTPATAPTTATVTDTAQADQNTTAAPTTKQITSSQVQNSPMTKSCVEGILSVERYAAINSGTSRPTTEELAKIQSCFATANYVLPARFSPLDPSKAKSLQVDESIIVSKLENVTKKSSSGNKKTLKISGKAKPSSVVILQIFSDPLVITTSTDGNGNWQYTLEDPLQPGDHEVYAIVDKGDGSYKRSDPMSFFISTASASAVNPNGLSLSLGKNPTATPTQSSGALVYYIAGSVAVLVVVLVGLYEVIRLRKKQEIKTTVTADELSVQGTPSGPSDNQPSRSVPIDQIDVTSITDPEG